MELQKTQHFRIPFTVELLSDLAHGGDGRKGIVMPFRRKVQILKEKKSFDSYFANETDRRNAVALVLFRIYRAVADTGRMTILNEFSDAVEFAAYQPTIQDFLEKVTARLELNLNKVKDNGLNETIGIIDLLDCFAHDLDFLIPLRREHQFIMLLFRKMKDVDDANRVFLEAEKKEAATGPKLFEATPVSSKTPISYNKFIDEIQERTWLIKITGEKKTVALSGNSDYVPFYSGNALKGICRRLLFNDFIDQILIGSGKKLSETAYHRWFTGGSIKSSTEIEEVYRKHDMHELCPPLAVLGSAVESGTIPSCATFSDLLPQCSELGTGGVSFYELTYTKFGTRHDSLKLETEVDVALEPKDPKKKEAATQMYYMYEVMKAGSTLSGQLTISTRNEIALSCFARMINLLKKTGMLGAKNTVGNGEVLYSGLDLPNGITEDAYLNYLAENKAKILAYNW